MSKFIVVILLLSGISVSAQQICKVKIEALQGTYIGDCKKGYANGKGKANGTDSYIGEFRNGYPDGKGTYVWSNEDIYDGEWKKGQKHGQGKLIVYGDTLTGYWYRNDYIGKDGKRYKLESHANNIAKVTFVRIGGEENRIDIRYEKEAFPFAHPNILIVLLEGAYNPILIQNESLKIIEDIVYPFRANIDSEFKFIINQPGHWEVTVSMTPTRWR